MIDNNMKDLNITKNLFNFIEKFKQPLIVCVDMDGTIIKQDVTWDSFFYILKKKPYLLPVCLWWILWGRSYFKYKIETVAKINFDEYTYNKVLLDFLKQIKDKYGKDIKLVLVTAANEKLAKIMFNRLKFFDEYIGSNSRHNYRAEYKAEILNSRFGKNKYIYAGNSVDDLKVWADSAGIIAVVDDDSLRRKIETLMGGKEIVYCYGFEE